MALLSDTEGSNGPDMYDWIVASMAEESRTETEMQQWLCQRIILGGVECSRACEAFVRFG
jgi:hypothetical protein